VGLSLVMARNLTTSSLLLSSGTGNCAVRCQGQIGSVFPVINQIAGCSMSARVLTAVDGCAAAT
jgi:hypothetical protein